MKALLVALIAVVVCAAGLAQESSSAAQARAGAASDDAGSGLRSMMPDGWSLADEAARKSYSEAAKVASSQRLVWLFARGGTARTELVSFIAEDLPPRVTFVPDDLYAAQWLKSHPRFKDNPEKPKTWGTEVVFARTDFVTSEPAERHLVLLTMSWEHKFYRLQAELSSAAAVDALLNGMNVGLLAPPGSVTGPVVRVSESMSRAFAVKKYPPGYPPLAREARIQGLTLMRVLVNAEGKVMDVHIVSGHPMLAPEAMRVTKLWRYKPYELDGKPVNMQTEVTIYIGP